jgi:hypothetical protein
MGRADTLPAESRLNDYAAPGDYLDTFLVPLPDGTTLRPPICGYWQVTSSPPK